MGVLVHIAYQCGGNLPRLDTEAASSVLCHPFVSVHDEAALLACVRDDVCLRERPEVEFII